MPNANSHWLRSAMVPSGRKNALPQDAAGRFGNLNQSGGKPAAYLVACTSGAGAGAAWISWNCGSGRRPGGLASLVQQHEAASMAKAETTSAERMRIMGWMVVCWKVRAIRQNGRLDFIWMEARRSAGSERERRWGYRRRRKARQTRRSGRLSSVGTGLFLTNDMTHKPFRGRD